MLSNYEPDVKEHDSAVTIAAEIIRNGGIVAFPTETVYGLGADAFNARAVARIFEVKRRPRFDPLIVHIYDISQLEIIAENIPESALKLIEHFWPGPLTIIVPKRRIISEIVTAGLPNVGVRVPRHQMALELLKAVQSPIAAPSANIFGHISPTTAEHVKEQLGNQVDMVLDGGACSVGIESTVISFVEEIPLLLRHGGIPLEEIEKLIGHLRIPKHTELQNASPGRSLRHYAPQTPLVIEGTTPVIEGSRKGLLCFNYEPEYVTKEFDVVEILSPHGDLNEAACNLFAALRRLDQAKLDVIVAKKVPEYGLGVAINDRLWRASQSRIKED